MKIEWYQLGLFVLLVVSGIVCNTQYEENRIWGGSLTEWHFLDNTCTITAKEIGVVEAQKVFKNVEVKLNNNVVFENNNLLLFNHFGILPIVRTLENNNVEVLMGIKAPNIDKINRLIFRESDLIVNDTLPLFSANHKNIDEDNFVEFAGHIHQFEPYCGRCDSVYYNPLLYYEMNPFGFKLDTLATNKWIDTHYEQNFGFVPDKKKVVRLKKPTINI